MCYRNNNGIFPYFAFYGLYPFGDYLEIRGILTQTGRSAFMDVSQETFSLLLLKTHFFQKDLVRMEVINSRRVFVD